MVWGEFLILLAIVAALVVIARSPQMRALISQSAADEDDGHDGGCVRCGDPVEQGAYCSDECSDADRQEFQP